MQNAYIIKICDSSFFHHWKMYIDLWQVNEDMGRKERDQDGKLINVYPVSKVKRLFKFANQRGELSEPEAADLVIYDKLKRIAPYWEAAKKWRK